MSEDTEILTLEEALVCIRQHFTEPDGLVAHIEKGLEIDDVQVGKLEGALSRLHLAWQEQDLVPKQDVRLLWNVVPRLEKCLSLYPERTTEMSSFLMQVSQWIEAVFSTPLLSEEGAVVLLCQHIFGTPPFCVDLYLGNINEDALSELFVALDTLADAWKKKAYISKLAAHAMVGTPEVLMSVSEADSIPETEKQRLQVIEQELAERITKCLN
jgi:hypothetical protein